MLFHVFMDFFLKIYTERTIGPYDLICANACVRWDVSARVGNSDIGWIVAHRMACSFFGSERKFTKELLAGVWRSNSVLRVRCTGG